MMSYVIAIDGPAGSGKGTIAKLLSTRLSFLHLDSGAIYRCVTLETIERNIKLNEVEKIANLIDTMQIEFKEDGVVFLNGKDVTKRIRENDINNIVSDVAKIKELREKVEILQRGMAKKSNIIMEGRDIGTTVFPNADLKFYLDADIKERANRRYKENLEKGIDTTYDEVLNILKNRDYIDMNREVSPLKRADDAILIDATYLTIDETVNKLENIVKEKLGGLYVTENN